MWYRWGCSQVSLFISCRHKDGIWGWQLAMISCHRDNVYFKRKDRGDVSWLHSSLTRRTGERESRKLFMEHAHTHAHSHKHTHTLARTQTHFIKHVLCGHNRQQENRKSSCTLTTSWMSSEKEHSSIVDDGFSDRMTSLQRRYLSLCQLETENCFYRHLSGILFSTTSARCRLIKTRWRFYK